METPEKFKTYWVVKDGKRQPVIIDSKKVVNGYSLFLMSRSFVFTIGLPVFGERIVAVKAPNGHTEVFEPYNSFSDAIERFLNSGTSMKKSHDNCSIKLVWRVIDSHWCCISCPEITEYLFDYLWGFGFVIPPSIRCCVADNCCYKLIFRRRSGKIITIIHQKF